MALRRSCDNPGCETALEVDAETIEDLPAGWWVLERSDAVGVEAAQYTLCSLKCVATVAELFDVDTEERARDDAVDD